MPVGLPRKGSENSLARHKVKTWYDNTERNTGAEPASNTEGTAVQLAGRHLQILPSPPFQLTGFGPELEMFRQASSDEAEEL